MGLFELAVLVGWVLPVTTAFAVQGAVSHPDRSFSAHHLLSVVCFVLAHSSAACFARSLLLNIISFSVLDL
jgi:hypothetical protein